MIYKKLYCHFRMHYNLNIDKINSITTRHKYNFYNNITVSRLITRRLHMLNALLKKRLIGKQVT